MSNVVNRMAAAAKLRQEWGGRVLHDPGSDGMAVSGLYADWLEDRISTLTRELEEARLENAPLYTDRIANLERELAEARAALAAKDEALKQALCIASGRIYKKAVGCGRCGCSQDLPAGLQSCRCTCHPANSTATADAALSAPAPQEPDRREERRVIEAARHGIYVASKCKHAPMWRQLRSEGSPIISTWIDEAGEGESADYAELADRCLREIKSADRLVLYCESGDVLKGALIEVGAALASGIPVFCFGECESLSRVFREHPLWSSCGSLRAALDALHGGPDIET